MNDCLNCKAICVYAGTKYAPSYHCTHAKHTNGERIREMTDEELATILEIIAKNDDWDYWLDGKTWLDWLKQEAIK